MGGYLHVSMEGMLSLILVVYFNLVVVFDAGIHKGNIFANLIG